MKSGPVSGPGPAAPAGNSPSPDKIGADAASKEETVKLLQTMVENLLAKTKKADEADQAGQASPSEKEDNGKDKELLKLLMKLLKGDIAPEEMEKLGKLMGKMGIKPEELGQAQGAGTENDV